MEGKKQTVLVIGGGGREHAIVDKLLKSDKVGKILAIPGNAGINEKAACFFDIAATDIDKIVEFVSIYKDIDLVVVAPDDPLALGLVDKLEKNNIRAFGPKKAAAQLESSKVFSKAFMKRHNIPTAEYETFSDYSKACEYLKTAKMPIVIKADGLALGKGVTICQNLDEAELALKRTMLDKDFGSAGSSVVVEEFLEGFEVTVLAFCDGKTLAPMLSSQDHKRAYDNDKGPNTGGMGTFAPSQKYTPEIAKRAAEKIFNPTVQGLIKDNIEFKGIIYFGLIVDSRGEPKVIEYNARFGDPETQVVLPLLESDLLDIFDACIDGTLDKLNIKWKKDTSAVCVCLASGGYPLAYEKHKAISIGKMDDNITVYHAGTIEKDGKILTNGGRVLGVTAVAKTQAEARDLVYKNIKKISFDKMHYRTDIGNK